MQNEILLVADAVSGEKGLPKSSIFDAIQVALATATKKRYNENSNIEVLIDSSTTSQMDGSSALFETHLVGERHICDCQKAHPH